MTRRRTTTIAIATLVALSTTLVACGDDEDDAATTSSDGAFPATVETMFGTVTIEEEPTTIVALGWGDAETALALGLQPVGASDWLAFGGEGVGPWAAGLYDTPPEQLGTLELNFEAIAALDPDVILNTRSDGGQETYDTLSEIAPTIGPPPDVSLYSTTWRQQMEMVSTALGKVDEGAALIEEVDTAFADAAAANPAFADKSTAVGSLYGEGYGAYVRGDGRVDFMESLGFVNKPEIQDLASNSFFVEVSNERLDLLDADLTVMFPIGDGALEQLLTDPLLQAIPSAADGRMIIIDDLTLGNAFSSGTTLGTLYAIDNVVPLFAAAVG
jgi:iron complex transport system substrate-binding protein